MHVQEKGTSVVLLLYNENPHQYYMAEKCCRITTKELEEVYKLAKVTDLHPIFLDETWLHSSDV